MKREDVYQLINGERAYQDGLWPRGEGDAPSLSVGEFVLMLEEYSNKARNQWTIESKPEENTMEIVRKIAAIAVNALEQHGARPR